ncbi:MAG TPA: hypothetical protein VJ552_00040 [Sediminibacterium sp.]|nr:hypothetical protein [Sediminibacterium sp.]
MPETGSTILYRITGLLFILFVVLPFSTIAQVQQQDTVFFLAKKQGLLGKIGKSISVNNPIPNLPAEGIHKNADEFEPYRGKIIRKIHIHKLGFGKLLNDTGTNIQNIFSNIGDALHTRTKAKVIANNLFFTSGDILYPNLMADNEKLLRDLSYLQDARITIASAGTATDSVDVLVFTKDVFPVGGSMDEAGADRARFEINDDNLFGSGNRIQIQHLFDTRRMPAYGIGMEYLTRNIAGSFVNIAVGYQNQKPAFNSGRREEQSVYVKGTLPLVSPYHAFTGGFELSMNKTVNRYGSDSLFKRMYQYNYRNVDLWAGYSLGARKNLKLNLASRYKRLLALRIMRRDYLTVPEIQATVYDSRYTDLNGVLASFTLFEQDFFHTNFIYGFGRNEDVPEGFNLSFTGGWTNKNGFSRIYAGFDYQRNYFDRKSTYLNYTFKAGAYYNQQRIEDISLLTSIELFTKLRRLGASTWYSRHFLSGSLTQQINTFLNDPVLLSSIYGLPMLNNPTTRSSGRATLNAETVFYNTWKFFGFSFAPFSFCNISYLKDAGRTKISGDLFSAFGAGVRTRNENLVFGTMELKAYYFPKTVVGMNTWNVTFSTNLKFRYITELIRRPDVVQVN